MTAIDADRRSHRKRPPFRSGNRFCFCRRDGKSRTQTHSPGTEPSGAASAHELKPTAMFAIGADAVLHKPFGAAELIKIIKEKLAA
jgi:hypothetical protein